MELSELEAAILERLGEKPRRASRMMFKDSYSEVLGALNRLHLKQLIEYKIVNEVVLWWNPNPKPKQENQSNATPTAINPDVLPPTAEAVEPETVPS